MKTEPDNPFHPPAADQPSPAEDARVRQITGLLHTAITATDAALALSRQLSNTLATGLQSTVKPPLNAPQTRDEILAAHRRLHRSGGPSKIESDPELQAFINARIDTQTYAKIVSAVRAHFPADRRTSIAAVGRWSQKRRRHSHQP